MAIKTVIFDLDDTLLWDKKSIADAFAKTCVQAAQKYPQIDGAKLEDYVRSAARTLYEGYEKEPKSMEWVSMYSNANLIKTDFFEAKSTAYAKSTALVDDL